MFREFKIGELFDVHPTKAYKLNNSDLLSKVGQTPVVVNSSQNNGIGGYSELEPTETPGILTFSDTTSGQNTLFYQSQSFIGYPHVQGMYPKKFTFNNLTALFMVATLRATLGKRKWDYSNKLNRAIVIEMKIQLPVKPGTDEVNYTEDDIDWDYMESYIHDLEQSYIHDLEQSYIHDLDAYLQETGLNDYTLTDDEQALLEREPMFREFKVGDLFDVTQGRRLKKSDFIDGDIPFVMASSRNNGVVAYLSNPVTTNENFITADILGNVFYHDGFVGFGDDNCGLKLKNGKDLETIYLYLVGALSCFKSIASYGNKLRGKWYKEQFIKLPVKPGTDEVNYTEDDIDWDYMESYIRAMEKHVIADVVDYKNSEITTAKELVYV